VTVMQLHLRMPTKGVPQEQDLSRPFAHTAHDTARHTPRLHDGPIDAGAPASSQLSLSPLQSPPRSPCSSYCRRPSLEEHVHLTCMNQETEEKTGENTAQPVESPQPTRPLACTAPIDVGAPKCTTPQQGLPPSLLPSFQLTYLYSLFFVILVIY
jgi:hypothetical protein